MAKAAEVPEGSTLQRALRGALKTMAAKQVRVGMALAALVAAIALSAAPAHAQQGTAVLIGNVKDASSGKPLGDAVVTVTSPALQGEEIAVTDEAGAFRIPALPPGTYTLRVEKETFRPYAREGLDLHVDMTIRVNPAILPEGLKAQEVVVVGRTPTVDVGSSATGMNITDDFTRRIPLSHPASRARRRARSSRSPTSFPALSRTPSACPSSVRPRSKTAICSTVCPSAT